MTSPTSQATPPPLPQRPPRTPPTGQATTGPVPSTAQPAQNAAALAERPPVRVTSNASELVRALLATPANDSTDRYLAGWMNELERLRPDTVDAHAGSLRALLDETRARAVGDTPLAQGLSHDRIRTVLEQVEGVLAAIETRTGRVPDPTQYIEDARWLVDRLTPRAVARAMTDPRGFDRVLGPVAQNGRFPGELATADVRSRITLGRAVERLLINADDPRWASTGMSMAMTVTRQVLLNRADKSAVELARRVVAVDPRPAATAARLRQFANLLQSKQEDAGTQPLVFGTYDGITLAEHLRGVSGQINEVLSEDFRVAWARAQNFLASPAGSLIEERALNTLENKVAAAVQTAQQISTPEPPRRPSATRMWEVPDPQATPPPQTTTPPPTPTPPVAQVPVPASDGRVNQRSAAEGSRGPAASGSPSPGAAPAGPVAPAPAAPSGAAPGAAPPAPPTPARTANPAPPAPPGRFTKPASGPVEPRSATPDLAVDPEVAAEYALLGSLLHAPGVLPHLETFLEPANFVHGDTRAVYRTLLGLHRDGMLFDVASLEVDVRTAAANENHVKLITALRGQTYAEQVVANPARVIARMNAAAPLSALPYKGVYEPVAQVELGGKILEAAFVREARELHLELKADRPLLSTRRPDEQDVQRQIETLEDIAANVEDMATRLTEATRRAGREVQPVDTGPAAAAAAQATRPGWLERIVPEGVRDQLKPVLHPFQHRAERLLLHLVLHAGRLDEVPQAVLDLDPEQFSDRRHANLWRTVQDLRDAGQAVNYVSVMLEAQHNPDGHRPLPSLEALTRMAAPPVDPETKEMDRDKVTRALRTVVNSALQRTTTDTGKAIEAITASTDIPLEARLAEAAKAVDGLTRRATTALRRHEQATAVSAAQGKATR